MGDHLGSLHFLFFHLGHHQQKYKANQTNLPIIFVHLDFRKNSIGRVACAQITVKCTNQKQVPTAEYVCKYYIDRQTKGHFATIEIYRQLLKNNGAYCSQNDPYFAYRQMMDTRSFFKAFLFSESKMAVLDLDLAKPIFLKLSASHVHVWRV